MTWSYISSLYICPPFQSQANIKIVKKIHTFPVDDSFVLFDE